MLIRLFLVAFFIVSILDAEIKKPPSETVNLLPIGPGYSHDFVDPFAPISLENCTCSGSAKNQLIAIAKYLGVDTNINKDNYCNELIKLMYKKVKK